MNLCVFFKSIFKLIRLNLSIAVAFSSSVGFIVIDPSLNSTLIFTFMGVFFLSASASSLNQFQERKYDSLMSRTKIRPLPLNIFKPSFVLILSVFFAFIGFVILMIKAHPIVALLGLFNLLWYNLIYTPLKRKTGFSIFLGALNGVIPVLMGALGAGGMFFDAKIISILIFMFFWQISHFLVILITHEKDYKIAGFISLLDNFKQKSKNIFLFISNIALMTTTLLFLFFKVVSKFELIVLLIIIGSIFIFPVTFIKLLKIKQIVLYFYQILIFTIIILNSFLYQI